MMEQNCFGESKYYAYSYNELNDLYLIRGVDAHCFSEEVIGHIPDELIENLVFEEYVRSNRIFDTQNSKGIISYSKNRYYAVVDFKGRHFTEEQVMAIVYGRVVENKDIKGVKSVPYSTIETDKGKSIIKKLCGLIH